MLVKKSTDGPRSGLFEGQRDLDLSRPAHSSLVDADAVREAVSARARDEVKVPSMEGTSHLTPGDDPVAEEGPLVRADTVKYTHMTLMVEHSKLASTCLQRPPGPVQRQLC